MTLQEQLDKGESPYSIYLEINEVLTDLYGLTFQGGLIFHLDTTSGNTLIAAPVDQSDGVQWGCTGTNITDAEFSEIGNGSTNTTAITDILPPLQDPAALTVLFFDKALF